MRFYVRLDGAASAKSLSISDNATVGEVREALKCNGLEWLLDDGAYAQAADSRSISGLIADGLHATGQSAAEAVHLRSISQGELCCLQSQNGCLITHSNLFA